VIAFVTGMSRFQLTFRHFMALLWIHIGTKNTPDNDRSGGGITRDGQRGGRLKFSSKSDRLSKISSLVRTSVQTTEYRCLYYE
jgi:hypothetical protein